MSAARVTSFTCCCDLFPHRNGLPEAHRPCRLATTCPGPAHSAETVSLPVHGAVPGADWPVYPLHSGAVHKVRRPSRNLTELYVPELGIPECSQLSPWERWEKTTCSSREDRTGHVRLCGTMQDALILGPPPRIPL